MCYITHKYDFTYSIAYFKGELLKGVSLFITEHIQRCILEPGDSKLIDNRHRMSDTLVGTEKNVAILLAVFAPHY